VIITPGHVPTNGIAVGIPQTDALFVEVMVTRGRVPAYDVVVRRI
jgi:hypothetical protein